MTGKTSNFDFANAGRDEKKQQIKVLHGLTAVKSDGEGNYYFKTEKTEKSENTLEEKIQLAFRDEDTHLTAATDLPDEKIAEAAKAMVALAVKKGWASIEVGGTTEFQAEVRKAAAEFGLEVTERDDSETQLETAQQNETSKVDDKTKNKEVELNSENGNDIKEIKAERKAPVLDIDLDSFLIDVKNILKEVEKNNERASNTITNHVKEEKLKNEPDVEDEKQRIGAKPDKTGYGTNMRHVDSNLMLEAAERRRKEGK